MDLVFFIIINLFIQLASSGHLIVFIDRPKLSNVSGINAQRESRRIMCVTDRLRDAIAWNTNLNWDYKNISKPKLAEFPRFSIGYEQQCRFDVDDIKCFSSWSQQGGKWNIVHSYDVPMGPVYDNRWENFTDFESKELEPIKVTKNGVNSSVEFGTTGSIAFSLRGQTNAEIMICETHLHDNNICYNIIISGSQNTPSRIRLCNKFGWAIPIYDCFSSYDGDQHEPLSTHEWRTFVLTWENKTNTIKLFAPDKKILSYSDHNSTYKNSNKSYHLFYGSLIKEGWFRFHDYSYTLTTDRGAVLQSSPIILGNSDELCIDMMVGLCKHCGLIVNIIDGSGQIRMTKRIRRSSKYRRIGHDLPMWQNEIIKDTNISNYPTPLTLEFVTSVISEETDATKDHWAIRNLELCLPEGTSKAMKVIAYQYYLKSSYSRNYAVFQRLSYDDPKSEKVGTISMPSTNSHNFENCLDYSIGPNCAIKCGSFFEQDCYGVQVCTENGCSCAQGWQGSDCTTECPSGSYGFKCLQKCSTCINETCDSYTGKCDLGCKPIFSLIYMPPYCNTVKPPSQPFIDELQETSARVFLYEEEIYKTINATFEFEAKTKSGNILKQYAQTNIITNNGTERPVYYAKFSELTPGEKYSVSAIINMQPGGKKEKHAVGSAAIFLTPCNWSKKFKITPGEESLLIEKMSEKETHPCPDSWYSIDLFLTSPTTNKSLPVNISNTETKFPIVISKLHPLTKYEVCVNGRDNQFQICQISSTRKAVPSLLENFQIKSITTNGAELIWTSSKQLNNNILGYNLTIKVLYYVGCENEKNTPETLKITKVYSNIAPTTNVSYNLTDLIPYVTYEATVIAFNSRVGNKSSLIFSTKPRGIPTEVFTNINFSHNNLTWDNPFDCWTITGPIKGSMVIITGVSKNVKNFFQSYNTKSRFLNLKKLEIYGNEKYQAKVFVPHKFINTTAYIYISFTTDPSPPPKVRNLQIIEIDELTTTLRWQEPSPPANGELDFFCIRFLGKNGALLIEVKVYLHERCDLWKNSFCKTVLHPFHAIKESIEVMAHNKGVSDPGEPFIIDDNRQEQVPEKPEIISITEVDKGVLYLKWKHPSITGGPMTQFLIFSRILDTELERLPRRKVQVKRVPVSKYEPEYSTYLYLVPSTRYGIYVHAGTSRRIGKLSTKMIVTNSSLDFLYEPRPILDNNTFLINIIIPPVVNNTKDSQLHIIVKGPSICMYGGRLSEQMMKDIQIDNNEVAWHVTSFPTYQTANLSFTIGDDLIYDTVSNCPLNMAGSYVIILLVYEKMHLNLNKITAPLIWQSESIQVGEISKINHASWAIPFVFAILCIAFTTYYCLRKRRNITCFDVKRRNRPTKSIPIYPITAEENNGKFEHVNKKIEDIPKIVNVQNSILKTLSSSTEHIYETIDPLYLEITDPVKSTYENFEDYSRSDSP